MLWQTLAVARNTFTEALRQPIYAIVLLGTLGLLALNPALSAFSFEDDNKLLIDLGLSTLFLGGLVLAVFTASGVLSREIENQTALTVVSKPIGRPVFVLGKYLGVCAAIGLAGWIWSAAFLMTVRHGVLSSAADTLDGPVIVYGAAAVLGSVLIALWGNYFYRWVFASALTGALFPLITAALAGVLLTSKNWTAQPLAADLDAQMLVGLLLLLEALALLCAVAVAASTRLGQIMTLLVCGAVFLIGLGSRQLFAGGAGGLWGVLGTRIFPDFQLLWLADALTQKRAVGAEYVWTATGYTALYVSALLGLAIALFQRRELS